MFTIMIQHQTHFTFLLCPSPLFFCVPVRTGTAVTYLIWRIGMWWITMESLALFSNAAFHFCSAKSKQKSVHCRLLRLCIELHQLQLSWLILIYYFWMIRFWAIPISFIFVIRLLNNFHIYTFTHSDKSQNKSAPGCLTNLFFSLQT